MSQLPLPVGLKDGALFETFAVAGNEQAVGALRAHSAGAPLIWLWGPVGAGKTHLLQAACAERTESGGQSIYLGDGPDCRRQPDMLLGLEAMDLVAVDDVQQIAGEAQWERRLFHLCNELTAAGGQLILAADASARVLDFRLPDLRSRLMAGLSFQLKPLDEDGRVAALRLHARRRGLDLADSAAVYLLHRVSRDMTSLCDWLATLDAAALAAKRRLTVPFIREVLQAKRVGLTGE